MLYYAPTEGTLTLTDAITRKPQGKADATYAFSRFAVPQKGLAMTRRFCLLAAAFCAASVSARADVIEVPAGGDVAAAVDVGGDFEVVGNLEEPDELAGGGAVAVEGVGAGAGFAEGEIVRGGDVGGDFPAHGGEERAAVVEAERHGGDEGVPFRESLVGTVVGIRGGGGGFVVGRRGLDEEHVLRDAARPGRRRIRPRVRHVREGPRHGAVQDHVHGSDEDRRPRRREPRVRPGREHRLGHRARGRRLSRREGQGR